MEDIIEDCIKREWHINIDGHFGGSVEIGSSKRTVRINLANECLTVGEALRKAYEKRCLLSADSHSFLVIKNSNGDIVCTWHLSVFDKLELLKNKGTKVSYWFVGLGSFDCGPVLLKPNNPNVFLFLKKDREIPYRKHIPRWD